MTLIFTAAGIDAWSTGIIALTLPTVSTTLAPGWRWIARMIARFWLNQAEISSFSPALTAWPISRVRTGGPLRLGMAWASFLSDGRHSPGLVPCAHHRD